MQLIKQAQNIYYPHSLILHLIQQQQQQNNSLIDMQVTNQPTNKKTSNKQINKQLTNQNTFEEYVNLSISQLYNKSLQIVNIFDSKFLMSKRIQFFKQGYLLISKQKANNIIEKISILTKF
ncbi:hypothetical protein ABPG74_004292 [Tetrahymena malaccensis]